jgi:hypothetical protein
MAAHSAGVIHRDLKPGNIMIRPDGYIKVIDFGLAKQVNRGGKNHVDDRKTITRPGLMVGTLHYMSPEQIGGDPVDHRTDLWSLGVILYELVTGQRPFEADTEIRLIGSILQGPVPPIQKTGQLPPGLYRTIERALSKDPAARYQSAREFLRDLQSVSHSDHPSSTVRPLAVFTRRSRTRRRALLTASAVAVLVLVVIAVGLFVARTRLFGPQWFQIDRVHRLTFNGQTRLASISPDGKYLAYVAGDPHGMQALYLTQVDSASEEIKIEPRQTSYIGLTFAPDNELYVVTKDQDLVGKLFRVPLIGRPASHPITVDVDGPVAFSPSGDRFAFVRRVSARRAGKEVTESAIMVAPRNGSSYRRIMAVTDSSIYGRIDWSRKKDRIVCILVGGGQGQTVD